MSKRNSLAPPFVRAREVLLDIISRPLRRMPPAARFALGFTTLVFATTLLIVNPYLHSVGESYREGDVVQQTVVSPADITETDALATEEIREMAVNSVRPIFVFEPSRAESATRGFRQLWDEAQRANGTPSGFNDGSARSTGQLPGTNGSEVGRVFAARRFNAADFNILSEILRDTAGGYVYEDRDTDRFDGEITLIERSKPNQQSSLLLPQSNMTAVSAARERLRERLKETPFNSRDRETVYNALAPLIQPSVTFDRIATDAARNVVAQSVQPVQVALKRNQVVAREGDTVTPAMLAEFAAIRRYSSTTRQWNRFLGLLFIIAALYWIARQFVHHRSTVVRLILNPQKTFALVALAVLLQTVILSVGFRLADFTAAQNVRAPMNDAIIWAFVIPCASAALLVSLLVDTQIALLVGILTSLITALIAPHGVEFALYAAISSATAVYGIERYRTRQAVTYAGLLIGLVNAATALALIGYLQQPIVLNSILLAIGCGIVGGLIAAAVTAVLLPIFESLFGILTDIKLLELSNADLPILSQLALRAPGTNQHSHAVGQLAQEACRVIGANPLLARIGALYHDIGKLGAPDYFVENQIGNNPHDRLNPLQSAKIIISHVTYGTKLAKEIGLPQRIIDFIPQHHGTRTLHYFLRKAQVEAGLVVIDDCRVPGAECKTGLQLHKAEVSEQRAVSGEQIQTIKQDKANGNGSRLSEDNQLLTAHRSLLAVNEADYRYPGPKPQFKESAVMMISDSCEAAVRCLAHPTPNNIRLIVNKIVDAILADDQLDECDLTLRELNLIRESMVKSLVSIYHARIDYPDFTPPEITSESDEQPVEAISNRSAASFPAQHLIHTSIAGDRGVKYQSARDVPISPGGEVETEAQPPK